MKFAAGKTRLLFYGIIQVCFEKKGTFGYNYNCKCIEFVV